MSGSLQLKNFPNSGKLHIIFTVVALLVLVKDSHQSHLDKFLSKQWKLVSKNYLKYEATVEFLKLMKETFPDIIDYYSIGKSVQGREMYVAKLRNGVHEDRPLLVPQMKIVANMHGDETIGRVLNLMLIVSLIKGKIGKIERIQRLFKETEIHLLITMNPDGFEVVEEGECYPDDKALGRNNANLKDLNRDFPDQFRDPMTSFEEMLKHRQPETQNVMKWIKNNNFVLSANLHALAVVASYPFDSVPPEIENTPGYTGAGVISYSPDHDFFFQTATMYANTHKTMATETCFKDENIKNGVVNGAEWYNVKGGMQDFNYVHSNCFEITFELSCCKVIPTKMFKKEWKNNKKALYKFIEATHSGVKGIVTKNGNPVANAEIHVEGIDHVILTNKRGEYWRLLLPGKYRIWVSHGADYAKGEWVKVKKSNPPKATVKNFELVSRPKNYRDQPTGRNRGTKGKARRGQKP